MLAVCGGKGGCGKTTTALAVAGVAAARRRRPVVVDCDRDMPNLHAYAEVPDAPGVADLARGGSLADVGHDAGRPRGVRVVPATPGAPVAGALDELDCAAPVVLDCPAGASEDAAVPLRRADRSLLVTTPARPCVRATVKTAAVARALDAPPVAVVVSRADSVPAGLPAALGVPPSRCCAVPAASDPLAAAAARELRNLPELAWPNA